MKKKIYTYLQLCLELKVPYIKDVSSHYDKRNYNQLFFCLLQEAY